jgi:hypothetical protein
LLNEYLDAVYTSKNVRALGLDIKYNQFEAVPQLMETLKRRKVKVIHLIRKNILKTYISNALNTMQKELGRKSHGTKNVPPVAIAVNPQECLTELRKRVHTIEQYRQAFRQCECLEVYYEDLTAQRQSEATINSRMLDSVYEFLGLKRTVDVMTTDLRKTNPDDLRTFVVNYNELAAHLHGTLFRYCLLENTPAPAVHMQMPRLRSGLGLLDYYRQHIDTHAAEKCMRAGHFEQARMLLLNLLQRFPGDPDIRRNLGATAGASETALDARTA